MNPWLYFVLLVLATGAASWIGGSMGTRYESKRQLKLWDEALQRQLDEHDRRDR